MRPVVSHRNWAEEPGASLTASAEAPGLGVARAATPYLREFWRTPSGGTVTLDVDLGAWRDVGLIALAAPRDGLLPLQHDTVRVQLSAAGPGGGDVLDTGAVSLDMPHGVWVYPLAAGVAPNRARNPSGRDGAAHWVVASALGNATLAQSQPPFALAASGGLQVQQPSGPNSWMSAATILATDVAAGEVWAAAVEVWSQRCRPELRLRFRAADFSSFVDAAAQLAEASPPPSAGRYRDAWRRLSVRSLPAPAGMSVAELLVLDDAPRGDSPVVFWAEAMGFRAEGAPADRSRVGLPFCGHFVPLAARRNAYAVRTARWARLTFSTARPYLQLGRVWLGPAWVPASGQAAGEEGTDSAGTSERAPLSGSRFFAAGAQLRRWAIDLNDLDGDDAWSLRQLAMEAGTTAQVVAMRSPDSWRESALFGRFARIAGPARTDWARRRASLEVEEDQ